MELAGHIPSHTPRSSTGCWTCRLRRKKCDEKQPVCDVCAALYITCYYSQDKPQWMDSGAQQEEMSERIKREVKDNAHRRRWERVINGSNIHTAASSNNTEPEYIENSEPSHRDHSSLSSDLMRNSDAFNGHTDAGSDEMDSSEEQRPACISSERERVPFSRSDTMFIIFYLEKLLPFLFPFYRPSTCEGGKGWILEMMISSPVARQATLCQSSYFFSLTRNAFDRAHICEVVAAKTKEAFETLRHAIQVILDSNIAEHTHGAARIMASIMQLQRYEIAILSFENCKVHIAASLAIFKQLLETVGRVNEVGPKASFKAVLENLGPPSCITPTHAVHVPSAEQSAFGFASTLLILDDIISSTVLQEEPKLYAYHQCLLGGANGNNGPINLEAVVGCQNWVVLEIGEIAALDAWKQRCKRAGDLDVMALVQRASLIKNSLEVQLTRLESNQGLHDHDEQGIFDFLAAEGIPVAPVTKQTTKVTRAWGHAALLYLSVVVSGMQPANSEVKYHISRVIEILSREISPPTLLRTMVWPFCVAGCLSDSQHEGRFRNLAQGLQPASAFNTVQQALGIMENVWRDRDSGTKAYDLAACFRGLGDPVLLV